MKQRYYKLKIAGLERNLPICPVNENLSIAGFDSLGDTELICAVAAELNIRLPEFDYILTAETKGIPVAQELARLRGKNYIVARKSKKLYMTDCVTVETKTITTEAVQQLMLSSETADKIKNRNVLIFDDVISTGGAVRSLKELADKSGAVIIGIACILIEGDHINENLIYLGQLPLIKTKK